jgi:hypothetical protein
VPCFDVPSSWEFLASQREQASQCRLVLARRSSRMLKKSFFTPARPWRAETRPLPRVALASFRPSTLSRIFSEVGSTVGALPFAKIYCEGERSTRSAVGTSSGLHSLRPCLGQGASMGKEATLADSGRARSLVFLSILRESSSLVTTRADPRSSSAPAWSSRSLLRVWS